VLAKIAIKSEMIDYRLPEHKGKKPKNCTECGEPADAHRGLCTKHYRVFLIKQRREKAAAEAAAAGRKVVLIGKNGSPLPDPGAGREAATGAPPKLQPDEPTLKRIRDLGGLQCTLAEVAGVLQCDEATVRAFLKKYPKAANAFEEGKNGGKASLRRMQYVQAKRNAAMAIWLGKNYLGQRDTVGDPLLPGGGGVDAQLGSDEGLTALLRAVRTASE
jgi:hypothetical protein